MATETLTRTPSTAEIVILHQYPRLTVGPSASVFALKLETYLRITKIPYQNDSTKPQSSKGKTPWITFNGQDVADSSFCIEFLKDKAPGKDLNVNLSPFEKGISRAYQKLVEEELYWVLCLWRWVYDKEESIIKVATSSFGKVKGFIATKIIRSNIKKGAAGQGIGRHTQGEVMKMGEDDITAIAEFLGKKKYFMGEELTDVDCSLFGLFAQLLYVSQTCSLTNFIKEKYPNIVDYCDRIKAEYWSDWDQICQTVKTEKEAKKKDTTHKTVTTTETIAVMNGNGTLNGHHEPGPLDGPIGNSTEPHAIETSNIIVTESQLTVSGTAVAPEAVVQHVTIEQPEVTSSVFEETEKEVVVHKENGLHAGDLHEQVAVPAM